VCGVDLKFMNSINDPEELRKIYEHRFEYMIDYRMKVWSVLCNSFFSKFIPSTASVMDIGCGYGEFINHIDATEKFAMDLNPKASIYLHKRVKFLNQDCSVEWDVGSSSLDVVFTSNFFEHLPDKSTLRNTLLEARRCLKTGGLLVAMGPNIKFCPGSYWDFWDHFLCLTDNSMAEALENNGYDICRKIDRFLPYTMVNQPQYPLKLLKLYLHFPILWKLFGKQFLVIASKK
jgi:SAM-dependent methyltransferase